MPINLRTLNYPEKLLVLDILNLARRKNGRDLLAMNDLFLQNLAIEEKDWQLIQTKLKLLQSGYPLDYLLSQIDFLDLKITVKPGVFIPRPETEECLHRVRKTLATQPKKPLLVDLCTGTGVIGLSLANYYEKVLFIDADEMALNNARLNAKQNQINNGHFIHSDLLQSPKIINQIKHSKVWDLACNPPYVPESDKTEIQQNNIQYEPLGAIFAGENGLDLFNKIVLQISHLPRPQNCWFELDPRNIHQAKNILHKLYSTIEMWQDFENFDRVLWAR